MAAEDFTAFGVVDVAANIPTRDAQGPLKDQQEVLKVLAPA